MNIIVKIIIKWFWLILEAFLIVADDHTLVFSVCVHLYYYQRKTFQKYSIQYLFRFCNLYLFTFPPIFRTCHILALSSQCTKDSSYNSSMYKTCKEIAQKENIALHLTMLLHTTISTSTSVHAWFLVVLLIV